jgi:pimeloyl-ACP methyl ester carboxylesterase
MVDTRDLRLPDGRTLRVHDTGPGEAVPALTLLWQHGSPQTGAPLEPLLSAASERCIRLLTYGRPGYGGSSPHPGRDVASAAADVAVMVDALEVDRLCVMGASGGGPHALACAALVPGRVLGAVCLAGLAPFTGDPGWYEGMVSPGGLRAAAEGRAARERYAASDEFDEGSFTSADWAALAGPWVSLGRDAVLAEADGPDGLIDDDVAFVGPWGFDVTGIMVPVLVVQGGDDRVVPASHADLLLRELPSAERWLRPGDGHISVLEAVPAAMDWLLRRVNDGGLASD